METYKLILDIESVHSRTFCGLGSAGYTWDFVIEGPPDIFSVTLETVKPKNIDLPTTYNSDYLCTITAIKQGNARIRLYLHRPWEHDEPSLREVCIDVLVV